MKSIKKILWFCVKDGGQITNVEEIQESLTGRWLQTQNLVAFLLTRKAWFLHRSDERRRLQTEVPSAGADVLLSSGFIAGNSSTSCGGTDARRFIFPSPCSSSSSGKVITSRLTSNFPHFLQVRQINWVVMCYKGCRGPVVTLLPLPLHVAPPNVFFQVGLVPHLNL